jgi:hypothetical protein
MLATPAVIYPARPLVLIILQTFSVAMLYKSTTSTTMSIDECLIVNYFEEIDAF